MTRTFKIDGEAMVDLMLAHLHDYFPEAKGKTLRPSLAYDGGFYAEFEVVEKKTVYRDKKKKKL